MINVCLKGHTFEYEIFELLRLFYEDKKIVFIDDKTLAKSQSILLVNSLMKKNNTYSVQTLLYKNDMIIHSDLIENVNDIKIYKENETKKIKIALKKSILKSLLSISNKKAPWGILTGIRPTKIVHKLIDNNISEEKILSVLENEYLIDKVNSNLLVDIAKRERKYINSSDKKSFSLYVGIPFCPTRCVYCSFPSHSIQKFGDLVNEYTDKLIYEIESIGKLTLDREINTVYIGGGTPTAIPLKNLEKIIKSIYKTFGKNKIKEFTVEAGRPDTITRDVLHMLKEKDIKRISINPQTMNDNTLSEIGRNHTSLDIIKAFNLAREIGFDSINMDIIVGLPNEDILDIKHTMEEVIKLNPDNLTVHTMAIKRASKLTKEIYNLSINNQKTIQDMINITKEYALKMNLKPYYMYRQKQILGNFENIGYCKEKKECIYNIMIMEEKETILALGAGATSKILNPFDSTIERVPNVKGVKEYIERIDEMIDRKRKILKNN